MIERRCTCGSEISVPAGHDKSRHGLCHCRSIGKLRDAFGVGQGQKPYVAAADAFNDVRDVAEKDLHRAGNERENGCRRALIRDRDEIDAGARGKCRGHKVTARTDAPGSIIELAGIGFGVGDEFGDRANAKIGMHGERHPVHRDDADRGQVPDRIVIELLHQRNDGELGAPSLRQGVAVVGCMRRIFQPDDSAASGRFSSTKGCPNIFASRSVVRRTSRSPIPPGP
jgi:head-tail adaptor